MTNQLHVGVRPADTRRITEGKSKIRCIVVELNIARRSAARRVEVAVRGIEQRVVERAGREVGRQNTGATRLANATAAALHRLIATSWLLTPQDNSARMSDVLLPLRHRKRVDLAP